MRFFYFYFFVFLGLEEEKQNQNKKQQQKKSFDQNPAAELGKGYRQPVCPARQ